MTVLHGNLAKASVKVSSRTWDEGEVVKFRLMPSDNQHKGRVVDVGVLTLKVKVDGMEEPIRIFKCMVEDN